MLVTLHRIGQGSDLEFERRKVVIHGGLQDGVGGVEVAVGQMVAHTDDLLARDARLRRKQIGGQGLDLALTASPISSSRIRTASKTNPSASADDGLQFIGHASKSK